VQQQNKEGALIDRCFEWNDSGASCTMQKGLHIQQKNNFVDFKCKAILLKTLSNYTIVLFKLSHLLRFSFFDLNLIQVTEVKYMSTLRKHNNSGVVGKFSGIRSNKNGIPSKQLQIQI
jgi:hypothetical protein